VAKNRTLWVKVASAEGRASGDVVGAAVIVGVEVFVTVGAAAVWVWNTDATRVWAPAAIVALTSGVGSPAAGCPPQDARKVPMSTNEINGRRAKYIIHLICELGQVISL